MTQQAFVNIRGVPTIVKTYGRWITEKPENQNDPEDIVLVVPGNPGVVGFYDRFTRTLHENLKCPVWILGHAGHESPKRNSNLPPLNANEKLYNIEAQVAHKEEFIKQYIPKNARLHIIGHSIGAYMVVELLKVPEIQSRVVKSYLLFPAIERMSETKNGKFIINFIKPIVPFTVFMSMIFTLLPKFISIFMVWVYLKITKVPQWHSKNVFDLVKPEVLDKVFFLAFDEMTKVLKRPNEILRSNSDKLRLLYAETDNWAPPKYFEDMQKEVPEVKSQMSSLHHCFVFSEGEEVGELVSGWIQNKN